MFEAQGNYFNNVNLIMSLRAEFTERTPFGALWQSHATEEIAKVPFGYGSKERCLATPPIVAGQ